MQSAEKSGLIIARLFPGENIFDSLQDICRKHNVQTAVVVSAVGQIKDFTLGYFDGKQYHNKEFTQTFELLSLSGMISRGDDGKKYDVHLHAVVGNEDISASGGHLFWGMAEGTNEIALLKTPIPVKRKKDEGTGLMGLYITETGDK